MLTAVEASGDGVVGCVGGYDRLWLTKAENHKLRPGSLGTGQ